MLSRVSGAWENPDGGDTADIGAVTVALNFVDYFSNLLLNCTLVEPKNQ